MCLLGIQNVGASTSTGAESARNAARSPSYTQRRPDSERGWLDAFGPFGVAQICILAVLFAWLFWAHLTRLFNYWQTPDWSHGFIVPLFCLYLVHVKRTAYLTGNHSGSIWGLPALVLSIGSYVLFIATTYGYPQSLAMIPTLAGLVLLLRGWRSLKLAIFPIAVLVLAIPPPTRLYRAITQPLQQFVASTSTFFLNIFPGVDEADNLGIHIGYYMGDGRQGSFAVAGACSGMRSLMAFTFLGLAIAFLGQRPKWQRAVVIVLLLPVAVFCNFLRVLITGSLHMYGHSELAGGTAHSLLGFLLFGVGIAIFLGILWILDHLTVEDELGRPMAPGGGT